MAKGLFRPPVKPRSTAIWIRSNNSDSIASRSESRFEGGWISVATTLNHSDAEMVAKHSSSGS